MKLKSSLPMIVALAATAQLSNADTSDKTVVEIAAGNKDFSTLVAAVKAAGLAETLSGKLPVHGLRPDQCRLR